ncbi:MAG: SDR family NAD(P)-dependent oxidoreductase [Planctomycetes bacterium]|nr:SDR family NAD(P)-dependent oxidoreductase [Planctomycetota bacterium]
MSISLEGKTILITGASSGIGAATARACAKRGMRCVITARRKEPLQALTNDLGADCTVVVGDVTEDGFNQHLLDVSGDVYAVFVNAGHGLEQTTLQFNLKQFQEVFRLNVFAAVELAAQAAKKMVENNSGHLLLCASCLSKFATPSHGAYCASKSALEAIAKTMRIELKPNNVFVSSVHPIGTKTEFFDESAKRSGNAQSDFASQTPSWLMQPPERVANAVVECLRKPKPEVWTSISMRLISTVFGAFPRASGPIINRFS